VQSGKWEQCVWGEVQHQHHETYFIYLVPMDFETFRSLVRPTHVVLGLIVLGSGLCQLVMKKGGLTHRKLGLFYYYAMLANVATALPLSIHDGNYFLTIIGCFSLFLVHTGFRFARIRETGKFHFSDRIAAVLFLLMALGMTGFSIYFFVKGAITGGIVLGVFGLIFLLGASADARHLLFSTRPEEYYTNLNWLRSHIGRMIGSYIAATTAFLVNVMPFGSTLLNWLLPTVIGLIVMTLFTKKYAPHTSPSK